MINIATVHWQTAKWIDAQLHYVARACGDTPYRVFASLNGIDDEQIWARFHFAADLDGNHGSKLNQLASIIAEDASPTDVLIFLDGDAFPIRSLTPWVEESLESYPLIAVRRDENLGDCQPHPLFCATTVGFWQRIEGDWRPGGTWINTAGRTHSIPIRSGSASTTTGSTITAPDSRRQGSSVSIGPAVTRRRHQPGERCVPRPKTRISACSGPRPPTIRECSAGCVRAWWPRPCST